MDNKFVGTIMVEKLNNASFHSTYQDSITFDKPIKSEELGLAELEKGKLQCLMCRYKFLMIYF